MLHSPTGRSMTLHLPHGPNPIQSINTAPQNHSPLKIKPPLEVLPVTLTAQVGQRPEDSRKTRRTPPAALPVSSATQGAELHAANRELGVARGRVKCPPDMTQLIECSDESTSFKPVAINKAVEHAQRDDCSVERQYPSFQFENAATLECKYTVTCYYLLDESPFSGIPLITFGYLHIGPYMQSDIFHFQMRIRGCYSRLSLTPNKNDRCHYQ